MKVRKHNFSAKLSIVDGRKSIYAYFRMGIIWILVIIQLVLFWMISSFLKSSAAVLYVMFDIVALVFVLTIIYKYDSSAYRIAWVVIVLIMPVFGLLLYAAWGRVDFNKREGGRINQSFTLGFQSLPLLESSKNQIVSQYPQAGVFVTALEKSHFPLYTDTDVAYFSTGEAYFEHFLEDIQLAKQFVFLEYFIICEGKLWDKVHSILLDKIHAGVEVRLLYDDVGSVFKIPADFGKKLRLEGFQVGVFNPAHRFVSNFYMNYRNHQKISVIDGKIGYTGGVNLADEYANIITRFGHWKDVGVRLEGCAVRTLTVNYLQMWGIGVRKLDSCFDRYLNEKPVLSTGYVQPYADGPANNPQNPALDLIRQAAGGARKYLWMTSPYLVLDHEIISAFCLAARGGVDTRIIVPAIHDHFYVGIVSEENYKVLINAGVHIFEYTPGFMHAKLMVFDDLFATVGSINLDYRSLYLHYENGIFLCGNPAVMEIKQDFEDAMALSHEITLDDIQHRPWRRKAAGALFNLFSPLM